jgi:UDP-N-acetylglucosamine:LPS N-acetylglucosamine transferase
MKIGLICSSGGHFLQLYLLRDSWNKFDHFWVTFNSCDINCLLKSEKLFFASSPTNRNIKNLLKNSFLAFKILLKEKPDMIVSTGAGVAVPFIYVAKLLGIKTVYIESVTRVNELSLSGKLIYPVIDNLIVQWPQLAKKYKKAKFTGQVI